MHKLCFAFFAAVLFFAPLSAQAGFVIEGSAGTGIQFKPDLGERVPTMIMLAPGYGLGEMIRAELGIVAELGDVENCEFQLQLRPMLVIDPPLIPVYGRLIVGLFNALDKDERIVAYGGALGVGGSLFGLGVFAEVAVLPLGSADTIIGEVRAGIMIAFD